MNSLGQVFRKLEQYRQTDTWSDVTENRVLDDVQTPYLHVRPQKVLNTSIFWDLDVNERPKIKNLRPFSFTFIYVRPIFLWNM